APGGFTSELGTTLSAGSVVLARITTGSEVAPVTTFISVNPREPRRALQDSLVRGPARFFADWPKVRACNHEAEAVFSMRNGSPRGEQTMQTRKGLRRRDDALQRAADDDQVETMRREKGFVRLAVQVEGLVFHESVVAQLLLDAVEGLGGLVGEIIVGQPLLQ